jgi:hypothetical protein
MKTFNFQWRSHTGEPVTVGDTTIVPQSRALLFTHPFGGTIWNRPEKLLVQKNGQEEEIIIADPTRWAIWGMMAIVGMITAVFILLHGIKNS